MPPKKLSSNFGPFDWCPCGKKVERNGVRFTCPDPIGHAEWEEVQESRGKQFTASNPNADSVQQSA